MLLLRPISSVLAGWLALTTLVCNCAWASDLTAACLYDVTIETGMPHLEENLRYAVKREQRGLTRAEIYSMFPVLSDASLEGCKLGDERRHNNTSSWTLVCTGGHGTTGHATWRLDAPLITGTLNVKLGGKNMTFYQRVTLNPLGDCEATNQR